MLNREEYVHRNNLIPFSAGEGAAPHSVTRIALPLLFLFSLLIPSLLLAQEEEERLRTLPELYPVPDGWFGIERTPTTDHLMLLDSLYDIRSQQPWRGLNPIDFVAREKSLNDSIGILLAHPGATSYLYRMNLEEARLLTPIWKAEGKGYNQIVAITEAPSSETIVTIAGDSGIAGITLDGTQVYNHTGRIRGVLRSRLDRNALFFAESYDDRTYFGVLNLRDGSIGTSQQINGSGEVILRRSAQNNGELLLLLSQPPTLYRIRESTKGFQGQHDIQRFPDAAVPLHDGGDLALLYRSLPSIEVMRTTETPTLSTLYYPLSVPFRSVVWNDSYVMLLGNDSVVVYDSDLDYLCKLPAVGGDHPRLIALDEAEERYLLTTEQGSSILTINPDPWRWFYPWQTEILAAVILLPLLILGLYLFRRYRLMRVMYMNIAGGGEAAGFIIAGLNGRVISINSSARKYIGTTGANPVGRHINFALAGEHLRPVLEKTRQLMALGEPYQTELNVTTNGSSRTLHCIGRPLYGRYGSSKGYLVMIQDITSVIEQDRLVNWASVAHHIAHEMKTPLGVIRTSAESLRHELVNLPDSTRGLTIAGRVVRQSGRLREIVDDLLTVARTEEMKLVDVDVALLLSSLVDDMREFVPSHIDLSFDRSGEDFRHSVDADQLTIAVRNVIDNARQAIGEQSPGEVRVTVVDEEKHIRILIADNGMGMSGSTLSRLFQPYYTEKEGGSGIGTVIIKRVVEGHGGTVNVESEEGVGTTFVLMLPRESS